MVAAIILGLITLVIVGLSRLSDAKRTGGTSLRRSAASHINANGSPKRGYASLEAAKVATIKLTAKTREPMSAYKCSTCKLYHVGHA